MEAVETFESYRTPASSSLSAVKELCVSHDLPASHACRPNLSIVDNLGLLLSCHPARPSLGGYLRARAAHLAFVKVIGIANSRNVDTGGSSRRCRGGRIPEDSHWGMTRLCKSVHQHCGED